MHKLWDLVLADALTAVGARRILEIGAGAGECTSRLLAYCEAVGGHLESVDPEPRFDVEALRRRYASHLTFHRCPSLEALPRLRDLDAALIDGDHNWYTVFHELTLLARGARAAGRELPLVFLHDVGWPYGRRDMYHAPGRIPPEFRQPCAQAGIVWGQSRLSDAVPFNAKYWNAREEGGPRNGVLTAVEDFVAQCASRPALYVVQVYFGLGILVPPMLQQHAPLLALLHHWDTEAGLRKLVEFAERVRLEDQVTSAGFEAAFEAQTAVARALEAELVRIRRSRSWRLTEPLRALSRLSRRFRVPSA